MFVLRVWCSSSKLDVKLPLYASPPRCMYSDAFILRFLASSRARTQRVLIASNMPMIGGGFEFKENRASEHSWLTPTKTGTTICGVVFNGGVVLGADTRSTNGETVADKNCEKIHFIAPNVYCCGAGTAADTESLTGMSEIVLRLFKLN